MRTIAPDAGIHIDARHALIIRTWHSLRLHACLMDFRQKFLYLITHPQELIQIQHKAFLIPMFSM